MLFIEYVSSIDGKDMVPVQGALFDLLHLAVNQLRRLGYQVHGSLRDFYFDHDERQWVGQLTAEHGDEVVTIQVTKV